MIRALLWMALLFAAAYIGYRYATPHVRAWRFRDSMVQTARLAEAGERDALRGSLLESAADLGVPLAPDGLQIEGMERGDIRISAAWQDLVILRAWRFGEWVDTLDFEYEVGDPAP